MFVVSVETVSASETWLAEEILHRALQSAHGRRVLSERLLLRRGVRFRFGRRRLRVGCRLLRLLNLLILGGELLLQAVDLSLKLSADGLNLFLYCGPRWRRLLLACDVLLRRHRSAGALRVGNNETGCQNCCGSH